MFYDEIMSFIKKKHKSSLGELNFRYQGQADHHAFGIMNDNDKASLHIEFQRYKSKEKSRDLVIEIFELLKMSNSCKGV